MIVQEEMGWVEAGHGADALVLLHGIGSNAAAWSAQLAIFSGTHRVIAWNAPGYANSEALTAVQPGPDDYTAALAHLLNGLGVSRCILLGHSLGAIVAARFAVQAPSRVAQLVLSAAASGYGCAPGGELPAGLQQRLRDIHEFGPAGMAARRAPRTLTDDAPPAILAQARTAMASVSVKGYADAVHLLAQGDLRQDLLRLERPLSVICGAADRITPLEKVAAATDVPARRGFITIPGAGHASYLEFAPAFNNALGTLLNHS